MAWTSLLVHCMTKQVNMLCTKRNVRPSSTTVNAPAHYLLMKLWEGKLVCTQQQQRNCKKQQKTEHTVL